MKRAGSGWVRRRRFTATREPPLRLLTAETRFLLDPLTDVGSPSSCPCLPCAVKIVQSGVKEVVYNLAYAMDEESARVLREGGVQLRRLSPVGGK